MNWRDVGPIPYSVWRDTILAAGGPAELAARPAWQAAGQHSALALAMLGEESTYGTDHNRNVPENRNPLNLRPRGGDGYLRFATYADGVREWQDRLLDPDYAYAGTVTLADLVNVYAPRTDSNNPEEYVAHILTRFERWGVTPKGGTMADLNMTKGLIPLPDYIEAYVDVSRRIQTNDCRGYDFLGDRANPPRGLVLHRPQSAPNASNEGYLDGRCCPALFDFEVLANGQAKRFAKLGAGAPSGWANGRVVSPYGDALKYLQHFGFDANDANQHFESCEVGGWFIQPGAASHEDPISEQQWAWLAQWIASRAHDYGIRWDTFPIIPAENQRSYVTWHQEWTIGTGKVCPGATLMNGTPALIERAKAIMKAAQTGGKPTKPPTYAPSILPPWWPESITQAHPTDNSHDGVRFYALRRNFVAKTGTRRMASPSGKAERSGPNLVVGEKVHGERYVVNGASRWILTNDGHYIAASRLSPPVKIG